jgi:hypothetical protein
MAVTVATLVARTRRFVRDWPEEDSITASVSSTASQITVADESIYALNWLLEIDQENLRVNVAPTTGTTVDVQRAVRGSTAASHASTSTVLIRPHFLYSDILDALNWAKDECFPLIYKQVVDTSLSTTANTFEYTVPSVAGVPLRYISEVELRPSGEVDYRRVRSWTIRRGSTPKLQFKTDQDAGLSIRIHGFHTFPDLVTGASTDTQWPDNAVALLTLGAGAFLLASGEAGRVRGDIAVMDNREQANRVGSSMTAANSLDGRFRRSLLGAAMPAMSKNAKPTF